MIKILKLIVICFVASITSFQLIAHAENQDEAHTPVVLIPCEGELEGKPLFYPPESRRLGEEGKVLVDAYLQANGKISWVRVNTSSGFSRLDQAALDAVAKWCFTPAIRNGNPIATDVILPVKFSLDNGPPPEVDILPSLSDMHLPVFGNIESPKYPDKLRATGNKGRVLLKVTIEPSGVLDNISVVESSHPAFEREAVATALKTQLRPSQIQNTFVASTVLIPINFKLEKAVFDDDDGLDPYSLPAKSNKNLPVEYQYDIPAKVTYVSPVVYPANLLSTKTTGSAKVSFSVSPTGYVSAVNILEATTPEFGFATRAMMQSWRFNPAVKNGQPIWSVYVKEQIFDQLNRDSAQDDNAIKLVKELKKPDPEIHKLTELDNVPRCLYQPLPVYPDHLLKKKVEGRVTVKFIIDSKGFVQLPQIVNSENEELAWLAITALLRWQYSPPTFNGIPVDAMVTIAVNFTDRDT